MVTISMAEFERLVQQALAEIPAEFRPYLENVSIEVHARPDRATAADLGDDLLGLYVGSPLDDRSLGDGPLLPDRVLIYKDNLCDMCETHAELAEEIRITVLHEVGHHFGLDEDRLEQLGYD